MILKSAGDDTDERGTRRTAEITGKSKECKHGGAAARTGAGSETEGAGPENTDRKAAEPAAGKSENRRRGERGGEVAYLPSGSTIIPADKSDKILEGSRQNNVSISRPYQPNIVVNVSGGADQGTIDALETKMRQIVRETHQEMQDEDETELAIQLGNA